MKLWILICILAALCGAGLVISLSGRAHAQAPGTVQEDGSVALPAGVPQLQQGQEVSFVSAGSRAFWKAVKSREYGLALSILLMLFVVLCNAALIRFQSFRDWVKPHAGEFAIALALASYLSLGLKELPAGATWAEWRDVLADALKTGLAATGAYEVILKRWILEYVPRAVRWAWRWVRSGLVRIKVLKPGTIDADKTPTGPAT